MFRHFGLDPTPSMIMRETAPQVYAWLARVWNARASRDTGALRSGVPEDWGPILEVHGCWEPLWRNVDVASGIDPEDHSPFGPGYSMTNQ